jgi:DNA-binding response OmpR family regulator
MTEAKTQKSIFIVEDDPFIAMDLEDIFLERGFKVIGPFADVDAGLSALRGMRPDFAMLDYNLGKETSIPLAQALNKSDIPYVFLSGQVEKVVIGHDIPARPVIPKPFMPHKLVAMVESLMNSA